MIINKSGTQTKLLWFMIFYYLFFLRKKNYHIQFTISVAAGSKIHTFYAQYVLIFMYCSSVNSYYFTLFLSTADFKLIKFLSAFRLLKFLDEKPW